MAQYRFNQTAQAALLAAIASAYPVIGYGAPAAQVDFAVGNVTAIGANGQSRALAKGAQIEQGDTVNTNGGRAQLRFTDGAYVSLQPQSEFRIDQYRFEGKADGKEKGFFSLLKGGLRTITGLVGRSNKANYQVSTAVATIGIRGTEYTIEYGQSITGTVGEGEIAVCNGAGCLSVTNGESYYVQGENVKPVLTNKRTDLPPPPPQNPPPEFQRGDRTRCKLERSCDDKPSIPTLLTGTITPLHVGVVSAPSGGPNVAMDTRATFNSTGELTQFDEFQLTIDLVGPYDSKAPGTSGNDGIIAWGRSSGAIGGRFGPGDFVHYVAGVPADMTAIGNLVATYTLLGATLATGVNNPAITGTLDKMTLIADFLNGTYSGTMNWTLESNSVAATFSGSPDGQIYASGSTSGSGSVFLQGFIAGNNAERAGFVYEVSDIFLAQPYIGAAALKQTSIVPALPVQ